MTVRTTHRHTRGSRYRQPGGAWDVPDLDRLLSARSPDAALTTRAARIAAGLRRLGVRRRDVVAWQLPNWGEVMALYRACWRIGAIAAPIHHHAGAAEVDRMLGVLDPSLSFAAPELPLSSSEGTIGVRAGDDRFDSLGDGPALDEGAARSSDLAAVLFTSGSTGEAKAVLHTHRGLAHKALTMGRVHGLGGDDAVLMPAPLAHISGLLNGILVPGAAGMRTVLMDKWDPEVGLGLIEQERVSFMIGPPALFVGLMAVPSFTPERVSSMRLISTGTMGVTPAFVTEASERFGAFVKRSYGSTEAPTVTTTYHSDERSRGRDTDGRAVGQAEIRVVDPASGRDRGAAEVGEVWVRGPELFAGYADPAETKAAIRRGWFRTGDLGVLDPAGWLTIVGRIKELIIRGGENVAPAEVERIVQAHPAVRQAVVVGYPDERMGERVAAFVVADDFDVATCSQWFESQGVARFKTPEQVVVVPAIPELAAGKPDRAALARQAAEAFGGQSA